MGYGGKVTERHRARELRAEAWTLKDIAAELGVSKSSVSLWVRDVDFVPNPRRRTRPPRPSSLLVRKLAEIDRLDAEGATEIGRMSDREFLIVGAALYAGEGFKRDGQAGMANTDPRLLALFVTWLRRHFEVDEVRLRVASTCTRASTWRRPSTSGVSCCESRDRSFVLPTERCPIPRSEARDTLSDAPA